MSILGCGYARINIADQKLNVVYTQICLLRVSFKNVVYDNFQDIATSLPGSYTMLSREYTKFINSISIHFIQKYKPLVTTFLFLECYCSQFFNNHSRLGQFVLYISSGCNTDIVLQSHCSYLVLCNRNIQLTC